MVYQKKLTTIQKKYALHGQGKRAENSGTSWNFHSVPLMSVIDKTCERYKMNSPNKN